MIKVSKDGAVVVEANGRSYDLSVSDQYADFLMWLTSPDEHTVISCDDFKADEDLEGSDKDRATRYSEFLKDYTSRRDTRLAESGAELTVEQRELAINVFIAKLKGDDN